MDRSIFLHINELINFARDIVLKFTPFEEAYNIDYYTSVVPYNYYDKTTYPYYRRMIGDQRLATTTIYGYSLNLDAEVELKYNTITNYQDVIDFYKVPSNMNLILSRYPNDEFIIRRLINPITSIDDAINADNLTILTTKYEDQFLNSYERNDLIMFLQDVLWTINERWFLQNLEIDDLSHTTFYAMIYSLIPFILLARRFQNMRSVNVHPFYIWEYLTSVGFKEYRGYLTREQEMFLYRNARYLKYNVGKDKILTILEKAFLNPIKYSLSSRSIIFNTNDCQSTASKNAEVISTSYSNSSVLNNKITFESLLNDIRISKLDDSKEDNHFDKVTTLINRSPVNTLTTKFLSFDQNIDALAIMMMFRFILDQTIYLLANNKLFFRNSITFPKTQNSIIFHSLEDILTLLYYCLYKRLGEDPQTPFTKYTIVGAIKNSSSLSITKKFKSHDGRILNIDNYIDTSKFINAITIVTDSVKSAKDNSNLLGSLFTIFLDLVYMCKNITDADTYEACVSLMNDILIKDTTVSINQSYTTYDNYFIKYETVKREMNSISTIAEYDDLMIALIQGLCPLEYGFADLANDDKTASIVISKIKDIFTFMVSYNVAFLNPTVERALSIDGHKSTNRIVFNTGQTYLTMGMSEDNDTLKEYLHLGLTDISFTAKSTVDGVDANIALYGENSITQTIEIGWKDGSLHIISPNSKTRKNNKTAIMKLIYDQPIEIEHTEHQLMELIGAN